jgi:hypothetical protein
MAVVRMDRFRASIGLCLGQSSSAEARDDRPCLAAVLFIPHWNMQEMPGDDAHPYRNKPPSSTKSVNAARRRHEFSEKQAEQLHFSCISGEKSHEVTQLKAASD